ALFYAVNKGGRVIEQAITRQAIFKICSKRTLEAKIPDFSPHDFRRTFVGDLLDAGADIVTVKDLAGHASIQTTARYDRRVRNDCNMRWNCLIRRIRVENHCSTSYQNSPRFLTGGFCSSVHICPNVGLNQICLMKGSSLLKKWETLLTFLCLYSETMICPTFA
ncbi:MAG: tyrosine-type recombinase/integrase, partial [Chloroflexi bacterium]|nr:tyrosine-type recombinase/integrase [Chloroflexota bacterium]